MKTITINQCVAGCVIFVVTILVSLSYLVMAAIGCGPVALTFALALLLFPDALPGKRGPVRINIRHFLSFIISMIIGGYLNIYVYAQPDTRKIIWLCGLPVVCALIYWGVNRQRKVKDL